jgi:hypothetical protein
MCATCDGPQRYRNGPVGELIEVPPTHCHHGHELGPNRVVVGHEHGLDGSGPHRSYLCAQCADEGRPDAVLLYSLD